MAVYIHITDTRSCIIHWQGCFSKFLFIYHKAQGRTFWVFFHKNKHEKKTKQTTTRGYTGFFKVESCVLEKKQQKEFGDEKSKCNWKISK